ncbi:Hypothetical predicted protein [Olea europaea subsp. europaea]|uniref:Uncharacterized protein n=1 Tax=Olea europaea subsp. europaea TaxID=158383 RepID=A0A8S0TM90_OLEEU|nr:Hypothetical predicted protein [Olea europaea subsp. europaea]
MIGDGPCSGRAKTDDGQQKINRLPDGRPPAGWLTTKLIARRRLTFSLLKRTAERAGGRAGFCAPRRLASVSEPRENWNRRKIARDDTQTRVASLCRFRGEAPSHLREAQQGIKLRPEPRSFAWTSSRWFTATIPERLVSSIAFAPALPAVELSSPAPGDPPKGGHRKRAAASLPLRGYKCFVPRGKVCLCSFARSLVGLGLSRTIDRPARLAEDLLGARRRASQERESPSRVNIRKRTGNKLRLFVRPESEAWAASQKGALSGALARGESRLCMRLARRGAGSVSFPR